MASRDRPPRADRERVRAIWRLGVAATEQGRLGDAQKAATGTDRELEAASLLCAANDQVRARERWLESVDDHDY